MKHHDSPRPPEAPRERMIAIHIWHDGEHWQFAVNRFHPAAWKLDDDVREWFQTPKPGEITRLISLLTLNTFAKDSDNEVSQHILQNLYTAGELI